MTEPPGQDELARTPDTGLQREGEYPKSADTSRATTQHLDASANGGRTLDAMANEYSRRAREARTKQGKPPVLSDPGVLNRIAELMALDEPKRHSLGQPAA